MRNYRYIFLLSLAALTGAGYVLVFGDVGLLLQSIRRKELYRLEEEVSSLQKENSILQERYTRLKEDRLPTRSIYPDRKVTILKFSNLQRTGEAAATRLHIDPANESSSNDFNLTRARAFYFSGMFLIMLIGYLLPFWDRKREPPAIPSLEKTSPAPHI